MTRMRRAGKHLLAVVLALLLGSVAVTGAEAVGEDEGGTVQVDIRVWQDVMDPQRVYLSGRPSGGAWRVAPEELPLEETNKRGTFRYTDRTVAVLVGDSTAYVDVRVWQSLRDPLRLYLSARPAGGKWGATERLPMDEADYVYHRHGDRTLAVPTPVPLDEDIAALLAWRGTQTGMSGLNWSRSRAMSSWIGVTVTGTPPRVTKLDLANAGLTGALSGLVGELTGLTELRLDGNALTGRIPSKVALLTRLTHVYLGGNALTGCVPPSLRAVANTDLATLGLPDCGTPVDLATHSRREATLSAGTYQYSLSGAERGVPLIFDVPEGLEVRDELMTTDAVLPPALSALVLEDAATGRSWIVIDDERGVVYGPRVDPSAEPGLVTLFDRLAESVWLDRGCSIATLSPCPETLRYNRLDTTGMAAAAGSYAFLKTAGSPASAIGNFGRSVEGSVELRVHPTDASGTSRTVSYDRVRVGDSFDYRTHPECGFRFKVVSIASDGTTTRSFGIDEVASYGGRCPGFVDDPTAEIDVDFVWGVSPGVPGPDGVRVLLFGEPAGKGTYRLEEGLPCVLDVPDGIRVIHDGLYLFEPDPDDPPDAPGAGVDLIDEESGSRLLLDPATCREIERVMSPQPEKSRDVGTLFDQIIESIRVVE